MLRMTESEEKRATPTHLEGEAERRVEALGGREHRVELRVRGARRGRGDDELLDLRVGGGWGVGRGVGGGVV
jgi:hypothetical protein